MRKIWIKKFTSFKEAEKSDDDYYLKMSPIERLNIMQFLREEYFRNNYKIRPKLVKNATIIKEQVESS